MRVFALTTDNNERVLLLLFNLLVLMIVINMIMILSIVVVLILCFDALITFQLACESLCIGFDYFKVSITGKEVS